MSNIKTEKVNSQNIRLILADDPLPALFMSSYLAQVEDDIVTHAFYVGIALPSDLEQDLPQKLQRHVEATLSILSPYVSSVGVCKALRYFPCQVSFLGIDEIKIEKRKRFYEIEMVRNALKEKGIDPNKVVEIWCRKSSFDSHFFYVCKNAVGVSFEHGLSDIRNALFYGQKLNPAGGRLKFMPVAIRGGIRDIKKMFSRFLNRKIYYFDPNIDDRFKSSVSLVGREIKQGNKLNSSVDVLHAELLLKRAKNEQLIARKDWSQIKHPAALVLTMVPYPKPWSSSARKDVLKLFHHFETYILEKYVPEFRKKNIQCIVFKSKAFFEDYTNEGVACFSRLSKEFQIIYLSDISEHNYPTEFYLPFINPKILIAAYSTALFFAKKIYPDIETFTYDEWFRSYAKENNYPQFEEFSWYREIFNIQFYEQFKNMLPRDVSV